MSKENREIQSHKCFICGGQGKKRHYHDVLEDENYVCDNCRFVASRTFNSKNNRKVPSRHIWLNLLKDSYDKKCNNFRCMISKMQLSQEYGDPLYLTLDHDIPQGNKYRIVAAVINDMKNDHTTIEFIRNIEILWKMIKQKGNKLSDKMVFRFEKTNKGIKNWKRYIPHS
jgi:hypothetical protein